MCRAVDEQEPTCPLPLCRVYHIIAIAIAFTVEPSPHLSHPPTSGIQAIVIAVARSGPLCPSCMVAREARAHVPPGSGERGGALSLLAVAGPTNGAIAQMNRAYLPFTGDNLLDRRLHAPGRSRTLLAWLVVLVPSRGPVLARRQLFRLFTPRSSVSLLFVPFC